MYCCREFYQQKYHILKSNLDERNDRHLEEEGSFASKDLDLNYVFWFKSGQARFSRSQIWL